MSLTGSNEADVYAYLKSLEDGALVEKSGAPYWSGGSTIGGPSFIDYNRTRRAPNLPDLVQALRGIVFSCSQLNQNAVARQPLRLYVGTGNGQHKPKSLKLKSISRDEDRRLRSAPWLNAFVKSADSIDEIVEHPLLSALEWVNPDFNKNKLIRHSVMMLDNVGAAYWWMEPAARQAGRFGSIDGIWPLLAQYVRPVRAGDNDGGLIDYYQYGTETYQPDNLVRMQRVSPVDPYGAGYGPTQAAFAYVGLADQFVGLQENMMTQGARMSLLLSNKDPNEPVGKPEREKFIREVGYGWARGNTGGIAWIDGAIDATPVTFPPSDLAALKITEAAMEEVARCFGVPLSLLRDSEGNRAVADAGHYQHALLAVDPLCEIIATAFTDWMRSQAKTIERALKARGVKVDLQWERLFWAFDSPVTADREAQMKVLVSGMQEGVWCPDEVRTEFGFEPATEWNGKEPFILNTKSQPSVAEEQRQTTNARADLLASQPKPALPGQQGDNGKDDETKPPAKKPPKKKAIGTDEAVRGVPSTKAILRRALKRRGLTTIAGLEPKQRMELLHELRLVGCEWMRRTAEDSLAEITGDTETKGLAGDAADAAKRFFGKAKKFTRNLIFAGVLALGGPKAADAQDMPAIIQQVAIQHGFLNDFMQEVLTEAKALEPWRAEMYGSSVWGAAQNVKRARAGANGLPYERRVHLGSDEPCVDCKEEVKKGWVDVGTLREITDSECRVNCHCRFLFGNDKNADENFDIDPWNMPIPDDYFHPGKG